MLDLLINNFGSFEAFTEEFREVSITVEGSCWSVLAKDSNDRLVIFQIEKHNFLNLIGFTPILVNDVWEHAYYLDYKNDRGAYVDQWWKVLNWEEVLKRFKS